MIIVLPCKFTVSFEEMEGSPIERLSSEPGRVAVTRFFKCSSTDRIQLAKEFLGYVEIVGADIIVHEAHLYPTISNYVQAVDVNTAPFGKITNIVDNRFANYEYSTLEVIYKMPQTFTSPAYGSQVQIIETIQGASEFLTLPNENLFWGKGTDKKPIGALAAPGKIISLEEWTYSIRGAKTIPELIKSAPGKINSKSTTSTTLARTFPAGTLFFGNPLWNKEISFDAQTFDLTLKFLYKNHGTFDNPKGWNYYPRTGKSGADISWERLTDGTNDKDIYEEEDFGAMII